MTIHVSEPPVQHGSPTAPRSRAGGHEDWSVRRASSVAGIGLLAMAAVSVFSNFVVLEGLVTPGDAVATARAVMASETLFRLGIVGWVTVVVLDVVVAWALLSVFAPVDRGISRLAAWLRLAYAAVLMVAVTELLGVLRLLGDGDHLAAFSAEQLQGQALLRATAFTDVYDAGLVLFGLHLVALGYLAYRSGYVPRTLGVLLGIAGIGYLIDSATAILGEPTNVGAFTFVGEFLLAVWLVVWGRRVAAVTSASPELVEVAR